MINQLLLLRNFATLRIKGTRKIAASCKIAQQWHDGEGIHFARHVQALACHYQVFEQLPTQTAGGYRGCLIFRDERVQNTAQTWLMKLPTSEVNPRRFCRALTEEILPCLGINKTAAERTAWRWLINLGWRQTRLKKGVYMDGHERSDVIKYQNNIFLPLMAKYEKCMVKWLKHEDRTFKRVEPELGSGEKQIVPLFQDKSSFHASKYKSNVWSVHSFCLMVLFLCVGRGRLWNDKQMLMKKGRGRIIHMSDFIEEENGCLIVRNRDSAIVRDTRCITYPGANDDAWWDLPQLLKQVKIALPIFEEAHPGCCALFIFDQSSAHASLGLDVLCAFDMNRSNGGKQQKLKDTVIPMSNPDSRYRGLIQKMTLDNEKQKGLQQTLQECGFDVSGMRVKCSLVCPIKNKGCCMARLLSQQEDFRSQVSLLEQTITAQGHLGMFPPKFHCELNPIKMVCVFFSRVLLILMLEVTQYWGWCKGRYREVHK